jgi:hypothetical protein
LGRETFLDYYNKISILSIILDETYAMDTPTPRRRVAANTEKPASEDATYSEANSREAAPKASNSGINFVDILRGLVGLLIFTAAMSWFITGESLIFDYRKAPTVLGAIKRYFVRIQAATSHIFQN